MNVFCGIKNGMLRLSLEGGWDEMFFDPSSLGVVEEAREWLKGRTYEYAYIDVDHPEDHGLDAAATEAWLLAVFGATDDEFAAELEAHPLETRPEEERTEDPTPVGVTPGRFATLEEEPLAESEAAHHGTPSWHEAWLKRRIREVAGPTERFAPHPNCRSVAAKPMGRPRLPVKPSALHLEKRGDGGPHWQVVVKGESHRPYVVGNRAFCFSWISDNLERWLERRAREVAGAAVAEVTGRFAGLEEDEPSPFRVKKS